jgi:hypothetical protein
MSEIRFCRSLVSRTAPRSVSDHAGYQPLRPINRSLSPPFLAASSSPSPHPSPPTQRTKTSLPILRRTISGSFRLFLGHEKNTKVFVVTAAESLEDLPRHARVGAGVKPGT